MEEEINELLTQRKFGYAKIFWEIENYFCVTHKKKWEICSPEFSINGFLSIKWRFILKALKWNDEEYFASVYVERLESGDISLAVRVFWKLSCLFGNITISEKDGVFDNGGRHVSGIKNLKSIEKLHLISTDKFYIQATFLITRKEGSAPFERSNDIGLKALSQELCVLFNLKDYNDITVNVGQTSLEGHKAILTTVNKLLKDVIGHYEGNEVSVDWSNGKSAGQVFNYLYTGNLEHILRFPSISIDEAINYFGIRELQKYYMKDELILRTKFEGREFFYRWIVSDIKSRTENFLVSPLFGNIDQNITFRMRLGFNDTDNPPTEHISISLEASIPKRIQELYAIFDIVDVFGNSINLKKGVRWNPVNGGAIGIEDFVSRGILTEPSVVSNGTLCLFCSLFISEDSTSLSTVSNRSCLLTGINREEHYALFSNRMASLFETGTHSDLLVRCGNQRFAVHRCILSVRSPVFASAIRCLGNSRGFSIKIVDPRTVRIVLRYVYSGVLQDYEPADVPKIYVAAVKFGMLILKYQCVKILEDSLQILNVFDTLFLAYAHKDRRLKLATFKFIIYNRREIREQDNWARLVNENALYAEFLRYVSVYVQNNPEGGLTLEDF